jgi:IS5 family transposase
VQISPEYVTLIEEKERRDTMSQINLFGAEAQLEKLAKMGDQLIRINNLINWEMFRKALEMAVRKADYSKGGRPPFDVILMFKITMLQQWYGLSDEAAEYQITCRLDFLRFLGLELGDRVPDKNTIWDFKQALAASEVDRELFDLFNRELEESGIITHKGSIVDATFATAFKRHTTKKDDKALKEEDTPHDLLDKCEERLEKGEIRDVENVFRQIDLDARWAKKGSESFFGYKDHVKCDRDSKIITDFSVTPANVHDSQEVVDLIDAKDNEVDLDAGYVGEYADEIRKKFPKIKVHVCARAYRNKALNEEQRSNNKLIAHTRARIEHIFGYMTRFMAGITTRVHGITRVTRDITAKNLAYNLKRYVYITA